MMKGGGDIAGLTQTPIFMLTLVVSWSEEDYVDISCFLVRGRFQFSYLEECFD